jgi:hypothetical protein
MVAIAYDRIYVLYPRLSLRNRALVRWIRYEHQEPTAAPRPSNPVEQAADERWGVECGMSCPAVWKKARSGEGIAVFFWNGVRERWIADQVVIGKEIGYLTAPEAYSSRRRVCAQHLEALAADSLIDKEQKFKSRFTVICANH